ncbi:MAG: AraC family transcriptional regulator [Pseudomonadota bacterium]
MPSNAKVDALSGLAPLLRMRPELQVLCRFGAQWASAHDAERAGWAPFHIATSGACVIDLTGKANVITLAAGDIAVLPHGDRHVVRSLSTPAGAAGPFGIATPAAGAIPIKTNLAAAAAPETELICGRLRFEQAHDNLVLSALPDAIVVRRTDGPEAARLRQLIAAIQDELAADRAGAAVIATDLASALFVMVVRAHLDREQAASGLLGLLGHRQAARAASAMLEDPGRAWTLDELAAHANASRASLVRMFQKIAQRAPLEFLTELRLELARRKLAATDRPLAEIASEIGYQSESAFSRAFQRRFGMRPGEARAGPA